MRTAVERLQAKLWENNMLTNDDLKLFKEALEIEKEQIENAYLNGRYEADKIVMGHNFYAKQYYNETFKQQEQ
jgi:hypothetical protein